MRRFLAAVLAYAASKAVFALFNFQYSLFGDPFSIGKLAIDLGVFVALFAGFDWLLRQLRPFKSKADD